MKLMTFLQLINITVIMKIEYEAHDIFVADIYYRYSCYIKGTLMQI